MSYSDEHELLAREFEQWYRTVPADVTAIVRELDALKPKSAFERKSALYQLAARKLDIKVFRHFPFFFECNAGQSRTQRVGEGLSGYMLGALKPDAGYTALRERLERLDLALMPDNPYIRTLAGGAARVIAQGTQGLRREIERSAERALARRRRDFCSAARTALDAVDELCARFAERAGHMASVEIDPVIRRRLERMASFSLSQPATTLYEAMQGMIFWRELTQALEGANYPSWGCLDDVLSPYYESDIEQGLTTPEEARALIRHMLTYHKLRDHDARMSVTLGRRPGAFTLLVLDALDDDVIRGNDVCLYVGGGDPEDYRMRALELMRRGVTLLRRDGLKGRVEMVAGQAQRCGEETRLADVTISLPAVLMGTLLPDTVERWQGMSIDLYEGGFFAAEDIYRNFMDNLAALEQDIVKRLLNMLHERPQLNPMLLQSVAMPDCIVRARDVTECGALSTSIVIGFDGLGVFLRSLATIKQLCYDAQRVPMSKVLSALKANCKGDDALNRLMNMPKPEMEDALLEKFLHNVGELFMAVSERPEISVRPSLLQMPCMGAHLMATPDGRFAGEGLESDMLPARFDELGGGVSCQWAPEDEAQACAQMEQFLASGAGMLMLFTED